MQPFPKVAVNKVTGCTSRKTTWLHQNKEHHLGAEFLSLFFKWFELSLVLFLLTPLLILSLIQRLSVNPM